MPKLYLLSLLAFFVACSRDLDSTNNSSSSLDSLDDGECQFKVNGNFVAFKNNGVGGEYTSFAKHVQGTAGPSGFPFTHYRFTAAKGTTNGLLFAIASDSLRRQNYTYEFSKDHFYLFSFSYLSGASILYNGEYSSTYWAGDNININITSYKNGFISGNFTARFSPGTYPMVDSLKRGTTIITEGLFKNIPCSY